MTTDSLTPNSNYTIDSKEDDVEGKLGMCTNLHVKCRDYDQSLSRILIHMYQCIEYVKIVCKSNRSFGDHDLLSWDRHLCMLIHLIKKSTSILCVNWAFVHWMKKPHFWNNKGALLLA